MTMLRLLIVSTMLQLAAAQGAPQALNPPKQPEKIPGFISPAELKWQQDRRRVRAARQEKSAAIARLFSDAKIKYPPQQVFLRAFKAEDDLELWVQPTRGKKFVLLKTYKVCSKSGDIGPKRRRGDMQVPEGFYHINRFNPVSNFHLSLGVNYPNASDKILGHKANLGGDIFIHGDCVTIGCLPITDENIKELYLIALDTYKTRKRPVPVHIFPMRLTGENWPKLVEKAGQKPELLEFWQNLREGYDFFETNRKPPRVTVSKKGKYSFR